jgi:hypothetical protein
MEVEGMGITACVEGDDQRMMGADAGRVRVQQKDLSTFVPLDRSIIAMSLTVAINYRTLKIRTSIVTERIDRNY